MYAPSYSYGPGNGSQQPFNPNGAQGQPQNAHPLQQQPGQQPQQMMYNSQPQPQAYGAAAQPSPYGSPSPGMGGNAGAMGMMQNSGLAQMSGGQSMGSQYQTPYTTSPYGTSIATSSSSNLPQNYMPTSGAPNFQMNTSHMNMQQNRMQHPPQASTPNQRVSTYGGNQQHTPPNAAPQSQFATPQAMNQTHMGTPNNQPSQAATLTPQTPSFPPGSQTGGNVAPPMSPGSEAREKQRVTLLLDINIQLLMEASRIQTITNAEKAKAVEVTGQEPTISSEAKAAGNDYIACMRRLQSNLAYLAAIADRSHKPSSQIPPNPQIMLAPAFTTRVKIDEEKEIKGEGVEPNSERIDLLNKQYTRLQELFPGADLQKERNAMKQQAAIAQANQAKNNTATGGESAAKVKDDANTLGAVTTNQD